MLAAALALVAATLTLAPPGAFGQSIYRESGLSSLLANASCDPSQTRLLGKLATINSEDLCSNFGMEEPSVLGCTFIDLADAATARVVDTCAPLAQAPIKSVSTTGEKIPKALKDRRPLPPAQFPDRDTILQEEGATAYWHITSAINLFLVAPCDKRDGNHTEPFRVPPGWALLGYAYVPDSLNMTNEIPAIAMMRSADGSHLAFVIRGTRTAVEWRVDLTFLQGTDPNYPGLVSQGFLFGANWVWHDIEAMLKKEVVEGKVTAVSISGHSLGAAVATLLSYRMQSYLDDQLATASKKIVVGAMLFAAPNVGDKVFADAFNKKVNARRFSFQYDFVPQVPCAPRMMACRNTRVATWNPATPNVTSWEYSTVGGGVTFFTDRMPVQTDAWTKLGEINACQIIGWGLSSHLCSYPCYFSKFVPGGIADGRCLLWAEDGAKGPQIKNSSYCPLFPMNPEFPLKRPAQAKLQVGGPLTRWIMQLGWMQRGPLAALANRTMAQGPQPRANRTTEEMLLGLRRRQ